MAQSAHVVDVTLENFQAVVLQASMQVPVLVDFWADWCAPCKVLMPVLEKLANEYNGAILLAKVNADQQPDLTAHFGVRSLPTVKVLFRGQLVDEFTGALPESQIRALLDKYVVSELEQLRRQAQALLAEGHTDQALAMLRQANQADPENLDILLDLALISAQTGDLQTARDICDSLPAEMRDKPEAKQLQARLRFVDKAGQLPDLATLQQRLADNPEDAEALYLLSLHQVLANDFEAAITTLLELMQKNRAYGDDAGRKTLLEVFDLLGREDPLVKTYRRRLYTLLH